MIILLYDHTVVKIDSVINHSVITYRYSKCQARGDAMCSYRVFHKIRNVVPSTYLFFKGDVVRSVVTDT